MNLVFLPSYALLQPAQPDWIYVLPADFSNITWSHPVERASAIQSLTHAVVEAIGMPPVMVNASRSSVVHGTVVHATTAQGLDPNSFVVSLANNITWVQTRHAGQPAPQPPSAAERVLVTLRLSNSPSKCLDVVSGVSHPIDRAGSNQWTVTLPSLALFAVLQVTCQGPCFHKALLFNIVFI